MPMPEAPVDEYRRMPPWQDDIRAPRKLLIMQAKAETPTMEFSPERQFWPRVAALYASHHPRTSGGVHDICHAVGTTSLTSVMPRSISPSSSVRSPAHESAEMRIDAAHFDTTMDKYFELVLDATHNLGDCHIIVSGKG
jgi:hypothetical protein